MRVRVVTGICHDNLTAFCLRWLKNLCCLCCCCNLTDSKLITFFKMSCFFYIYPPPAHHKGSHAGTLWTEHNNPTVISFHQKATKWNSALHTNRKKDLQEQHFIPDNNRFAIERLSDDRFPLHHPVVQPDQLERQGGREKRSMVGAMTAQLGLQGVVDNTQPLKVEVAASFL